jgi:hypothetical protein
MSKYKTIIGRAESIDLPLLNLVDIPSKTDSGAYLSAIHASNIREEINENGKSVLRFNLLEGHSSYPDNLEVEVEHFTKANVENSFGAKQERYRVDFKVKIAGKTFKTPFTLADRSKKAFPILLGRTLLSDRFLIDTSIAHIDHKILKKKLKDWLAMDDQDDEKESV